MNITRRLWTIMAAAGLWLCLAACDNQPFEKAGRAVDRAVEKAGDKIHDATR